MVGVEAIRLAILEHKNKSAKYYPQVLFPKQPFMKLLTEQGYKAHSDDLCIFMTLSIPSISLYRDILLINIACMSRQIMAKDGHCMKRFQDKNHTETHTHRERKMIAENSQEGNFI